MLKFGRPRKRFHWVCGPTDPYNNYLLLIYCGSVANSRLVANLQYAIFFLSYICPYKI
jgi:hypothetical protein